MLLSGFFRVSDTCWQGLSCRVPSLSLGTWRSGSGPFKRTGQKTMSRSSSGEVRVRVNLCFLQSILIGEPSLNG